MHARAVLSHLVGRDVPTGHQRRVRVTPPAGRDDVRRMHRGRGIVGRAHLVGRMAVDARGHRRIVGVSQQLTVPRRPVLGHLVHTQPGVELAHERRIGVAAPAHSRDLSTGRSGQESGRGVETVATSASVARQAPEAGLGVDVGLVGARRTREPVVLEAQVAVAALVRGGQRLGAERRGQHRDEQDGKPELQRGRYEHTRSGTQCLAHGCLAPGPPRT